MFQSSFEIFFYGPLAHFYTPYKCQETSGLFQKAFRILSEARQWLFHNVSIAFILNISVTVGNSSFSKVILSSTKLFLFSELYSFGVTKKRWAPPDSGIFI